MKIIAVTAMHGRHQTVQYCLNKSPDIPRLFVYSDSRDEVFLRDKDIIAHRHPNRPLSAKWNFLVKCLRDIDFDVAVILGSDDYFDQAFIDFVTQNMRDNDVIGFRDMYFEQEGRQFYWPGYTGRNKNTPIGAGRCYSKKFLERINYELYPGRRNTTLDGIAWNIIKQKRAKTRIFTLKTHGLMLCDVKDGQGITPLHKISNLTENRMKIYIGMATFAGRPVQKAIDSLKDQCDGIFLYDNEKHPDLTDNGKFWGLTQIEDPCYYLTCDDDLHYPKDYVATTIAAINIHKCIITHHGRILQGRDLSYYRGHKSVACLHNSSYSGQIHVPGTGVTGFRTDYFHPKNLHLAKDKKMSDLVFGLAAAQAGKKCMTIPHKKRWIKHLPIDFSGTIHSQMNMNEGRQIEIANKIFDIFNAE